MKKSLIIIPALSTVIILPSFLLRCELNFKDPLHLYSNKIQNQVSQIDQKDLTERRELLSGSSAEGGEMLSYFENQELEKVSVSYLGETGRSEFDYYFDSKGLIHAKVKEVHYDKPIYVEGFKELNSSENEFYFKKGRLIRWHSEQDIPSNWCDPSYLEWEKRILENLSQLDLK